MRITYGELRSQAIDAVIDEGEVPLPGVVLLDLLDMIEAHVTVSEDYEVGS